MMGQSLTEKSVGHNRQPWPKGSAPLDGLTEAVSGLRRLSGGGQSISPIKIRTNKTINTMIKTVRRLLSRILNRVNRPISRHVRIAGGGADENCVTRGILAPGPK
jgi:hypothetical protein